MPTGASHGAVLVLCERLPVTFRLQASCCGQGVVHQNVANPTVMPYGRSCPSLAANAPELDIAAPLEAAARAPTVVLRPQTADLSSAPSWELPLSGETLVLNTAASGNKVAKAEGRLHGIHHQAAHLTRCGWLFKHSSNAALTTSFDKGVLCAACFKLVAGKSNDPQDDSSENSSESSDA